MSAPYEGNSNTPSQPGLTGTNDAQTRPAIGVRGDSKQGKGVHGETLALDAAGVVGIQQPPPPFNPDFPDCLPNCEAPPSPEPLTGEGIGAGVLGIAAVSPGVQGISQASDGVSGKAGGGGAGVKGQSGYGPGVIGLSTSGVGVGGVSTSGTGVEASGKTGLKAYGNPGVEAYGSPGIRSKGTYSALLEGHADLYGQFSIYDRLYPNSDPTVITDRGLYTGGIEIWEWGQGRGRRVELYPNECIFRTPVHFYSHIWKHGGGFRIDHPLYPADRCLNHSFVESPDRKNVYDGIATLDAEGEATVELPDWFQMLNRDFRYQLTSIGSAAPHLHIVGEMSENRFVIAGGTPFGKVSWQVTGIRQDAWAEANKLVVEEDKDPQDRGFYLFPEGHGESSEKCLPRRDADPPWLNRHAQKKERG